MYYREIFTANGIRQEYYYTLNDLMGLISGSHSTKLFESTPLADIVTNNFSEYVGDGYYKNGTYASKVWNMILAKYETNFILYANKELSSTDKVIVWTGFKKIITKLEETSFKYNALLDKLYEENLDLFGRIKSKSTTDGENKFNDTPQTDLSGGVDTFLSNLTKSLTNINSETDGENIVSRIREYIDKMENILDDWVREFNELFIESLNIN